MQKVIDKQIKSIMQAKTMGLINWYEYRMRLLKLCEEYGEKKVAKRATALGVN